MRKLCRSFLFVVVVAGVMLSSSPAKGAGPAPASWPWRPESFPAVLRLFHRTDKHERRANRTLARCLAPSAPAGEEVHNYDVAQGEFVAWWGAAEYQSGTVQVWWAHWPKRDHNPGLAGVIFSAYGVPVDSDLYRLVDSCTSRAVEAGQ